MVSLTYVCSCTHIITDVYPSLSADGGPGGPEGETDRSAAHHLIGTLQQGEGFDSQRYAFFDSVGTDSAALEGELGGLDDDDAGSDDGVGVGGVPNHPGIGDEVEITMDEEEEDLSLASMFMGLMKSKSEMSSSMSSRQQLPLDGVGGGARSSGPNVPDLPMPALLHKMPMQQPASARQGPQYASVPPPAFQHQPQQPQQQSLAFPPPMPMMPPMMPPHLQQQQQQQQPLPVYPPAPPPSGGPPSAGQARLMTAEEIESMMAEGKSDRGQPPPTGPPAPTAVPSLRQVQMEQMDQHRAHQAHLDRIQEQQRQRQSMDRGSFGATNQRHQRNQHGHHNGNRAGGFHHQRGGRTGGPRSSGTRPSVWMDADEIDRIARIQYMTLHTDDPYRDDYCYQATVFKDETARGTPSGKRHFAPADVRELLPTEKGSNRDPVEFLKIDGLGVFARSNKKAPKPMLDVGLGAGAGAAAGGDDEKENQTDEGDEHAGRRPLSDEPMLAARCLIEDGECLLLDIDDVDRILFDRIDSFDDGGEALRRRRLMLVDAVAASLHLTDAKTSKKKSVRDGVFIRVTMLAKGLRLFSRFLARLDAGRAEDREVVLGIMQTLLRNISRVFLCPVGPSVAEVHKLEAAREMGKIASVSVSALGAAAADGLVQGEGDLDDLLLAEEELPLFCVSESPTTSTPGGAPKPTVSQTGFGPLFMALTSLAKGHDSAACQAFLEGAKFSVQQTVNRFRTEKDTGCFDADASSLYASLEAFIK